MVASGLILAESFGDLGKYSPEQVGRAAAVGFLCPQSGPGAAERAQVQLAEEVLMLEIREERSVLCGPEPGGLSLETSMAK